MRRRRGRVILAGYPSGLPDLVSVRALDRALASGLTLAPPDLPRDLGNRSTIWIDNLNTMKSSDAVWRQIEEVLQSGRNVLRWFPDNPLATSAGRQDASDLGDAGIPVELVPVLPDELIALNFSGTYLPGSPRTIALAATDGRDVWVSSNEGADEFAALTIADAGTPIQRTSEPTAGCSGVSTHIGGPGAGRRIEPNWFESLPLFGQRILVTRTISQAPVLSRVLRELGAEPVEMPAIDIIPDPYPDQSREAADKLPDYDWVIFTSTNGVDVFLETVRQAGYDARRFGNARVAAIGIATAERLRRHFIEPDFVPGEFVAEAVLEGLRQRGINGRSVLIPRAEVARSTLPDGLRKSGASVDVVPVYRTIPGTPDPLVIDQIIAGDIDTVTFTSSSTVTNLIDMLDRDANRLANTQIACIGPITADTARQYGLNVAIVAEEYTVPGLIDALCFAMEDTHA